MFPIGMFRVLVNPYKWVLLFKYRNIVQFNKTTMFKMVITTDLFIIIYTKIRLAHDFPSVEYPIIMFNHGCLEVYMMRFL